MLLDADKAGSEEKAQFSSHEKTSQEKADIEAERLKRAGLMSKQNEEILSANEKFRSTYATEANMLINKGIFF